MPFDLLGPEALGWLRGNTNHCGLGSERFNSKAEAIQFVEWLYALGAERVVIPSEFIRSDPITLRYEGGPYAQALVVHLPTESVKREPLIWLCALEMGFHGSRGVRSKAELAEYVGSREVFLGWK